MNTYTRLLIPLVKCAQTVRSLQFSHHLKVECTHLNSVLLAATSPSLYRSLGPDAPTFSQGREYIGSWVS